MTTNVLAIISIDLLFALYLVMLIMTGR